MLFVGPTDMDTGNTKETANMLPNQRPQFPVDTPSSALTADEARAVLQEAARQQDSMERFMRSAVSEEEVD